MESSNEVINMTLVLSITLHKGQYKNITCFYKVRSQTEKFQNQRRKKNTEADKNQRKWPQAGEAKMKFRKEFFTGW